MKSDQAVATSRQSAMKRNQYEIKYAHNHLDSNISLHTASQQFLTLKGAGNERVSSDFTNHSEIH